MVSADEEGRRLNSESPIVTREAVAEAARAFLKAVAKAAKAKLGPHPERLQHSQWMVRTGPGSMSGKDFERKVFDLAAVSMIYQTQMMHSDFPEQRRLQTAVTAIGIPPEQTWYGFLVPLVHHWLQLPDPLEFEKVAISRVLDEFVDAVVDGRVITRSRDAINGLDSAFIPLVLEKGICIRLVTEDELWELGDTDRLAWSFHHPFDIPSEEWKILDIQLQHIRTKVHPPEVAEAVREATLVAFRLASAGSLRIIDLGSKGNYGMGAVGHVRSRLMPRELGRWSGTYVLDETAVQRLKDSWPRLRAIMQSKDHYLRLPAQRLVDGGARDRMDDALIDYAIGLETLLTEGIQEELRYRFALRGATILAWGSENKKQFFNELQDFYDVRSLIVHRGHVAQTKLSTALSYGEKALRDVWWWYFMKGSSTLRETTSVVDSRILE